jgi:hypothetical protein
VDPVDCFEGADPEPAVLVREDRGAMRYFEAVAGATPAVTRADEQPAPH